MEDAAAIPSSLPDAAPPRFSVQEELFIFCNLMLVTCLFLPWRVATGEITPWDLFSSFDSTAISSGFAGLFLLLGVTLWSVSRPRIRPWFGLATALAVHAVYVGFELMPGHASYGARLAGFIALGLLGLSANPALVKAGDLAMRRLNSRQAEVFSHSATVLPGIQLSTQEFYTKLEEAIRAHNWPGVEFLRVSHREAGLLSHQREYLRVVRQRQVIDACAARFGTDYFFTLREAEIQAQLSLTTLLIFLVSLALGFSMLTSTFGFIPGLTLFGFIVVFGFFVLFNVLRMGLTRLDGVLMRTPVIGPIYETWCRRSTTYFQFDSRVVFLKLMNDLLKEHVDEATSAQGVRSLSYLEHQPILDGFYKTKIRNPEDGEEK